MMLDNRSIEVVAERLSWNLSYQEGRRAHDDGKPATSNPYSTGNDMWRAFQAGWIAAAREHAPTPPPSEG